MKHKSVNMTRENLVYGLLRSVKTLSRCFFRFDISWIGESLDRSWDSIRLVAFLNHIHSDSMVIIMPEGRMMRRGGLDKNGKPMTVRGGIADLIQKIPRGRILMAYSGGLHHVQVPGQWIPRLFKTVQMRLESIDIQQYRDSLLSRCDYKGFKAAVIKDFESRRDRFCPF